MHDSLTSKDMRKIRAGLRVPVSAALAEMQAMRPAAPVPGVSPGELEDIRAAFAQLPGVSPYERLAAIKRDLDADYRRKRRRWDELAGQRAKGQAARQKAAAQRAGQGVAVAAAWPHEPQKPVIG